MILARTMVASFSFPLTAGALLLLLFSQTRQTSADAVMFYECPLIEPLPLLELSSSWGASALYERDLLEVTPFLIMPKTREVIELYSALEQQAWYDQVLTTKRYWAICCLFTKLVGSWKRGVFWDLSEALIAAENFLQDEENKLEFQNKVIERAYEKIEVIEQSVQRDADSAYKAQIYGELDDDLVQQSVTADNSYHLWKHLPEDLSPSIERFKQICGEAIQSTRFVASTVQRMRNKVKKLSVTVRALASADVEPALKSDSVRRAILAFAAWVLEGQDGDGQTVHFRTYSLEPAMSAARVDRLPCILPELSCQARKS